MLKKLQIPEKAVYFLNGWEIVRFPGRTLLHGTT
jgi:hypothetical protein